jgi:hypothetical protein
MSPPFLNLEFMLSYIFRIKEGRNRSLSCRAVIDLGYRRVMSVTFMHAIHQYLQPFRRTSALQLTHKSNQILFLLIAQLQLENDVEIFDCVLKR